MVIPLPETYNPLGRFLRVVLSVIVSLLLTWMVSAVITRLWIMGDTAHWTHLAGGVFFTVFFIFWPLLLAIAVVSGLLFSYDQRAEINGPILPSTLLLAGFLMCLGAFVGFPLFIPIFLLFYWLLTGRVAGQPGWSIRNFAKTRWDEKLYLVFMTTLLVAVFAHPITTLTKSLTRPAVAFEAGTPPYKIQFEHKNTSRYAQATHRFPDAQSCLVGGADAAKREDLTQLDWDKIQRGTEAEVCMFRLLHGWGDVSTADSWFEAQGFKLRKKIQPVGQEAPQGKSDYARVSWSIKNNGPKYPTKGLFPRILAAAPYSMIIRATYSADGQELIYVRVSFNTL